MFDTKDVPVIVACLFALVFLLGMYAGEAGNTPYHVDQLEE